MTEPLRVCDLEATIKEAGRQRAALAQRVTGTETALTGMGLAVDDLRARIKALEEGGSLPPPDPPPPDPPPPVEVITINAQDIMMPLASCSRDSYRPWRRGDTRVYQVDSWLNMLATAQELGLPKNTPIWHGQAFLPLVQMADRAEGIVDGRYVLDAPSQEAYSRRASTGEVRSTAWAILATHIRVAMTEILSWPYGNVTG